MTRTDNLLDADVLEKCFNEWMRRYTEDPKAFTVEFMTVREFLEQKAAGTPVTYGATCVAYLRKLAETYVPFEPTIPPLPPSS